MNLSSLLRIGTIPTTNKWFLIHTREWYRRRHIGMDPVNKCIRAYQRKSGCFQVHGRIRIRYRRSMDENNESLSQYSLASKMARIDNQGCCKKWWPQRENYQLRSGNGGHPVTVDSVGEYWSHNSWNNPGTQQRHSCMLAGNNHVTKV